MSEPRIRWEDKTPSNGDVYNVASIGYVGTVEESAFIIYTPDEAHAGWLLSVRLTPGSQFLYAASQDDLKAEAERWLAGFVSSLGAIFPDEAAADIRARADDLEAMVCREPGQERDNLLFSAGLKRAADLIEHGDIPGTTAATTAREKE